MKSRKKSNVRRRQLRKLKKQPLKIAVIDVETDPFKFERIPRPFASAFFDGEVHKDFWGKNCIQLLLDYISAKEEPYLIYAHNGGKFDFFFFLDKLENPVKIINGRIAESHFGIHTLRDSYSIIPIPLSAYQKDEIDYDIFEEDLRDRPANKKKILAYLKTDCKYLFDLVSAFNVRFGDQLTIGGTAIKTLREIHPFDRTNKSHDKYMRPYYFGGRVECFEKGVIKKDFKIYDVNSMYPHVMKNVLHPIGQRYESRWKPNLSESMKLKNGYPFFIKLEGINYGALPVRTKAGLDFNCPEGEFLTTSHELHAALEHGKFEIKKIWEILIPDQCIQFGDYVDKFMQEKIEGKLEHDKVKEIFAKLLLNSAYGKFGQNPDNYFDYKIIRHVSEIDSDDWELYEIHGELQIWRKKANSDVFYDVATAASITSASRAILLHALCCATAPVYCDTDSIVCQELNAEIDATKLGAWKLEAECDKIAIAGKKLYAAYKNGKCVKIATKGVKLGDRDILELCKGKTLHWKNEAPTFSLARGIKFVDRHIKMT